MRRLFALLSVALSLSVLAHAAAPAPKTTAPKAKAKPGPDVLVVGDASDKAPPEFLPTPEKPVYYVFLGAAERVLGAAWAGEKQPDKAVLQNEIFRVLASQNYIRTQVGGPMPQLAIVVTWGSANLMSDDFDETNDAGETVTSTVNWNTREISALVGADKARNKMLMSSEADQINDAARQDRLYVMVGALDAAALAKKQKKLIWRTRISIESRRTSLPESLTVMLNSAAPFFGKNTDLPIFVDDKLRKQKAEVQIGDAVVVPPSEEPAKNAPAKK
ncbi:MAG: hypothetical protein V4773_15910 [Verrucomicrobiota bacterium]